MLGSKVGFEASARISPEFGIHGDERTAVGCPLAVVVGQPDAVCERLLRGLLQLGVDREAHVVAGFGKLLELARARHAAERVDEDAPDPGQSAEIGVVRGLHPGLADSVAGGITLVLRCVELLLGDLAHVAEGLRRDPALVVVALVGLVDLDAGEVVLVLEQVVDLLLVDVLLDRDRRQEVVLAGGDVRADLPVRDVEERRRAGGRRRSASPESPGRTRPARAAPPCPACWRRGLRRSGRGWSRGERARGTSAPGCSSRPRDSALPR